jgi:hypothetical protein
MKKSVPTILLLSIYSLSTHASSLSLDSSQEISTCYVSQGKDANTVIVDMDASGKVVGPFLNPSLAAKSGTGINCLKPSCDHFRVPLNILSKRGRGVEIWGKPQESVGLTGFCKDAKLERWIKKTADGGIDYANRFVFTLSGQKVLKEFCEAHKPAPNESCPGADYTCLQDSTGAYSVEVAIWSDKVNHPKKPIFACPVEQEKSYAPSSTPDSSDSAAER